MTGKVSNLINNYLTKEKEALNFLYNNPDFMSIIDVVTLTILRKGTIYICGNGGSAATASHLMNDLVKGVHLFKHPRTKAICLSDNIPTITAIANDISYDSIYSYQLENLMTEDDILITFSGSGNSKNILNAILMAKGQGAFTISITGEYSKENKSVDSADLSLVVPSDNMQIIEDVHMIIAHLLTSALKEN